MLPSESVVYAGPICMDMMSVKPVPAAMMSSRSSVGTSAERFRFGPAAVEGIRGWITLGGAAELLLLPAPSSTLSFCNVASCMADRFRPAALFGGPSASVIPNPESGAELEYAKPLDALGGTGVSAEAICENLIISGLGFSGLG